jgi:hypothetical protein
VKPEDYTVVLEFCGEAVDADAGLRRALEESAALRDDVDAVDALMSLVEQTDDQMVTFTTA